MSGNTTIVEQWYRALADADIESFLSLHVDDVVFNISGHTVISGRVIGKRQLVEQILPQVFGRLQMDRFRFATRHRIVCADGQRVVGIMEADGPGVNGLRYDQRYVHIFAIRDGRIAEVWEFFDTALANEVLFDGHDSPTAGRLPAFEF